MDKTTIIAISALLISLVNFVFSIRNASTKNRLEIAEKQTELLRLLTEAKIILERTLNDVEELYFKYRESDPGFSQQLLSRKILLKKEYNGLILDFEKFSDYSKKHDPILFEQIKSDLNNIIMIGKDNLASSK